MEPKCPILALVGSEDAANKLAINYGVYTKVVPTMNNLDELIDLCIKEAKEFTEFNSGDNMVITGGLVDGKIGFTNLMKIETVR